MKFKPQYNNLYDPNKILTDEQPLPIPSLEELQNGMKKPESIDKLAAYNNLYDPNIISDGHVLPIPSIEELQNGVQNGMENPESFDNQKSYEDETHSKSR